MQRYAITVTIVGNLLAMNACARCGTHLIEVWKYCIHCGAPVASTKPAAAPPPLRIPGAIRPDDTVVLPRRKPRGVVVIPLLSGLVIAALICYLLEAEWLAR